MYIKNYRFTEKSMKSKCRFRHLINSNLAEVRRETREPFCRRSQTFRRNVLSSPTTTCPSKLAKEIRWKTFPDISKTSGAKGSKSPIFSFEHPSSRQTNVRTAGHQDFRTTGHQDAGSLNLDHIEQPVRRRRRR